VQNYYTRQVKEAILEAANQLGEDGEGYDGLVGYMRFLGRSEPKTFAMLLRAVMPTQVDIKRWSTSSGRSVIRPSRRCWRS
jgi:hypothetical protein